MVKRNSILIKHPINWGLSEDMVRKQALKALKLKKLDKGIELSVIFVGKKKAKDLNISFRHKDYIPQVLGFPLSREPDEDGIVRLGDIVICTQKLKYEVEFQRSSLEKIMLAWLVHGVENLLL